MPPRVSLCAWQQHKHNMGYVTYRKEKLQIAFRTYLEIVTSVFGATMTTPGKFLQKKK